MIKIGRAIEFSINRSSRDRLKLARAIENRDLDENRLLGRRRTNLDETGRSIEFFDGLRLERWVAAYAVN